MKNLRNITRKQKVNANSERISTHCVDAKQKSQKSKKKEESIIPGPIIPNLPENHEDMSTLMLNSFYPVRKTPETSKHKDENKSSNHVGNMNAKPIYQKSKRVKDTNISRVTKNREEIDAKNEPKMTQETTKKFQENPKKLEKQEDKKNQDKKPVCKYCGASFLDKFKLKHHIKGVHLKKKTFNIQCSKCEASFTKKEYLQKHIQKFHQEIKTYKCDKCELKFENKFHLMFHKNRVEYTIKEKEWKKILCK